MNVDHIPAVLRAERRWIVAKLETVNGRLTKVPYRADDPSRKASSTDPATWADFATAAAVAKSLGLLLGFMLGGGFVGVDFDHCVNDGVIEPWAVEMIDALNSYTELSVSGTGIHIICRGTLPADGRRKSQIEMYDAARYFVMTGDVLRTASIEDRTVELAALHARIFGSRASMAQIGATNALDVLGVDPTDHRGTEGITAADLLRPVTENDDDLLTLIQASAQGEKFARLWAGDWRSDYRSQSEADLALCSMLAFWTQRDDERIDRLFRRSKLCRWERVNKNGTVVPDKWQERDGYYRERTIRKAVNGTAECYQPPFAIPDVSLEAETPADMDLTTADVELI